MPGLFTEEDVVELRRLGWPVIAPTKFGLELEEQDEELLSALFDVELGYMAERRSIGTEGMAQDIRQSIKDAKKLASAFDKFANRHECVLPIYAQYGLYEAGSAIEKMCSLAVSLEPHIKGKHDPEVNASKSAAKELIELWARCSGAPPTATQGTGYWAAGNCFRYVLEKLTKAYGGELGDGALEKLLKAARANHNSLRKE